VLSVIETQLKSVVLSWHLKAAQLSVPLSRVEFQTVCANRHVSRNAMCTELQHSRTV